jgi:propionate CoA-transferase
MDRMNPISAKICTAEEAVALIGDGQTIATGGFVGSAIPETLTKALERRFQKTGEPGELTLVYAAGQGDGGDRGANHLAYRGLLRRVIGGHWALAPKLGKMALDGHIEAYNFPQGVVSQLFRDIAAGRPGCITHIGLDTFIDPAFDGGCLNNRTPRGLIERIELGGRQWLWYKSFPIHIGLIRGTSADPFGNLIMDREALFAEMLPIAQAVHNCGGTVIAQVSALLDRPACPQHVKVPGILIDRIVVAESEDHEQTFADPYNPGYCSPMPEEVTIGDILKPMPMNARRIIASRACDEIPENAIANLGIGMPEGIARIAAERNVLDRFTLTVESGPIGGIPAGGLNFGVSLYPQAVIDQPAQFDFYDGRGLDFAALGMAQADMSGNVNVSKYGTRLSGVGGFVNITQTAKRVVFCGTFTAGGLKIEVKNGNLIILQEGNISKFPGKVEQISFSGRRALENRQKVLYVTERAVFGLMKEGLELIEIAPGIDVKSQVMALMDFKPLVRSPKTMAAHIFRS